VLSVRSGAPISMPGMMDTISMWASTTRTSTAWLPKHQNVPFVSIRTGGYYRCLVLWSYKYQARFSIKRQKGSRVMARSQSDRRFFIPTALEHRSGKPFPMDPRAQLQQAVVPSSSPGTMTGSHYRRIHRTLRMVARVTVQAMVFGNYGVNSGTGVGFTRNPSSGEKAMFAEFLANARVRTLLPVSARPCQSPSWSERCPGSMGNSGR